MEYYIIAATIFLLLFITTYWYAGIKYSYWQKLGVPHVPGIFPLGSQYKFFTQILHEVEMDRYKKYGRIFGHYEGMRPGLTVADPDLLRSIYVKDFQFFPNRRSLSVGDSITDNMVTALEGEKWKRVRTIMTPAFTTGKIKKMTSIILQSAKDLEQNIRTCVKKNEPMDAKRLFGAFTMDVIASSAFGTKLNSHADPDNPFVAAARKVFTRNINWRVILFFVCPGLMKFLRIPIFSSSALDFFKTATVQIITKRKRTGQTKNDFLQLLMEAAGEVESKSTTEISEVPEEERLPDMKLDMKGMSRDELLAQCIIFFLVGYDTTASTLSFASYELARNPEVQDRLQKELDTVLSRHDGKVSYEAVQEMKYLDTIISETLRKHPPAVRTEREAVEDYELENTDLTIPKGMIVGTPVYAMHYDPEFYPDPEKFDPDRFTPEAKAARNPYTYMPFGHGPRNCLGMRFALIEIKICLAHILSQFRVETCSETKIPLEYYFGQGLLQPKGIILKIVPRD